MPFISVPILNPFFIVDKNRELLPSYNFKHFDAWKSNEQALEFQQVKCFHQKWQNNDIVFIQIKGDYDPVFIQVRNSIGAIVLSQQMTIVRTIGFTLYFQDQITFPLNLFPAGLYTLEFLVGDPVQLTLQAEVWDIREEWPGTLLFKYSNDFNNEVLYETGIYFNFRVDGVIPFDNPISTRTVYIDQLGSAKTVKGDAARRFKLYIGQYGGVPDWVIDKLEEIIDQNNLDIDGKPFAPNLGATWSTKRIDRYPWAQWNIEMREANNQRSKRFDTNGIVEQKFVEEFIVSGRLFGPVTGPTNDNTMTINEVR